MLPMNMSSTEYGPRLGAYFTMSISAMGTKGSDSSRESANPAKLVWAAATAKGNSRALRKASGGIPEDCGITGAAPMVLPVAVEFVVPAPVAGPSGDFVEPFGRPRPRLTSTWGRASAASASKGTAEAPEFVESGNGDAARAESKGKEEGCVEGVHGSLLSEFFGEGVEGLLNV